MNVQRCVFLTCHSSSYAVWPASGVINIEMDLSEIKIPTYDLLFLIAKIWKQLENLQGLVV